MTDLGSVSDSDEKNVVAWPHQSHKGGQRRKLHATLLAVVGFFAAWGAVNATYTVVTSVRTTLLAPRSCRDCGRTAEEAYARGCRWHSVFYSWMVPDCYDAELSDEFDALARDFGYFLDPEGNEPVSYDDFRRGQGTLVQYTSWDQQITHCIYSWLSLFRAHTMGSAPLWAQTILSDDEHHIRHCLTAIRDPTFPPAMRRKITTVIAPRGSNYTKPIWDWSCISEAA